jgi:flagellar motor switch/type III secretory pathway protein FliN
MDGATLTPDEIDALRAVMTERQPVRAPAAPAVDAQSIALIADDRAAERARPDAQRLGERWAGLMVTRLAQLSSLKLTCERVTAEIVDGPSLSKEIERAWSRALRIEGRAGDALVLVSGPIVEVMAARLLGAKAEPPRDQKPSLTALTVFGTAGELIVDAFVGALQDEQAATAARWPLAEQGARARTLLSSDLVIVVNVTLDGECPARVRLVAATEALAMPRRSPAMVALSPETLLRAVSPVPLEVRVELGRARLTLAELAALRPGKVITLDRTTHRPLPVTVGGVLKAAARPLVQGESIAVEIASLSNGKERSGE